MQARRYARFEGDDIRDREIQWLDLYPLLAADGYILRDRFNPGYLPTAAIDNRSPPAQNSPNELVSWQNRAYLVNPRLMDATRSMDGLRVMVKRIDLSSGIKHHEWKIARIFARKDIAEDPRNHCIRLLDYLRYPGFDYEFLVLPHMLPYDVTPFETVGEIADFLRQLLEGVSFMHSLNVAHRDIGPFNIVMYAPDLFPDGTNYLFPGYEGDRRSSTPRKARYRARRDVYVRYYLIDYGLSWAFKTSASRHPLEIVRGQLKDVPEYALGDHCDGFALDVWCVGRFMQEYVFQSRIHTYKLPQYLYDYVLTLTAPDPASRPTAAAALVAFDRLIVQVTAREQGRLDCSLTSSWSRMSILRSLRQALSKEQGPLPPLTVPRDAPAPLFPTTNELRGQLS